MERELSSGNPSLLSKTVDKQGLPGTPVARVRHHLGLPPRGKWDRRFSALADGARRWFDRNCSPWTHSRLVGIAEITVDGIRLADGTQLKSQPLARGFRKTDARAVVVMAISAGARVDREIDRLWKQDRPDEALFLNAHAIATTEHLRALEGAELARRWKDGGRTVLPRYSPGFDGWELADQAQLLRVLSRGGRSELPGPLVALESGALTPVRSTLTLHGISAGLDRDPPGASFWSRMIRDQGTRT